MPFRGYRPGFPYLKSPVQAPIDERSTKTGMDPRAMKQAEPTKPVEKKTE